MNATTVDWNLRHPKCIRFARIVGVTGLRRMNRLLRRAEGWKKNGIGKLIGIGVDNLETLLHVLFVQQGFPAKPSECKRDLDSRVHPGQGVLLNTSRLPRARVGLGHSCFVSTSANAGVEIFTIPLNHARKVASRAEIDGDAHCSSVERRTRINNTATLGQQTKRTCRNDSPKGSRLNSGVAKISIATTVIAERQRISSLRVYRMTATRLQRQAVNLVEPKRIPQFMRKCELQHQPPYLQGVGVSSRCPAFFGSGLTAIKP